MKILVICFFEALLRFAVIYSFGVSLIVFTDRFDIIIQFYTERINLFIQ